MKWAIRKIIALLLATVPVAQVLSSLNHAKHARKEIW
jgi:hypothetical protein